MRRRELILTIGGVASARSLAAYGQKAAPVIGYLNSQSPASFARFVAAFRDGLRQAGYIEGQNLAIEYRWAEGDKTRLAPMAADLVRSRVAVIGTGGGPDPALAAKAATDTIPIVSIGGNPIELGLVASLNHPGGNVTGVNILSSELDDKRLGLLHEMIPGAERIAVLLNPNNPNASLQLHEIKVAAGTLGQQITILNATNDKGLDAALGKAPEGAGAWLIGADPFFNSRRDRIVEAIRAAPSPGDLRTARVSCRRWADQLRHQPRRGLSASRRLCRQNSRRRQTGRIAGGAVDPLRACHQPENSEGVRPHRAAAAAGAGRRGS